MLTIEGLIAVISLCVTCFGLGYAIGSKDNDKTQKQPPQSGKLSGYLSDCFRANRLSAVPKGRLLQADALFSIGIVTYAVLICNMKKSSGKKGKAIISEILSYSNIIADDLQKP